MIGYSLEHPACPANKYLRQDKYNGTGVSRYPRSEIVGDGWMSRARETFTQERKREKKKKRLRKEGDKNAEAKEAAIEL